LDKIPLLPDRYQGSILLPIMDRITKEEVEEVEVVEADAKEGVLEEEEEEIIPMQTKEPQGKQQ